MDSAEFLDLLGNANRRRILRLLAQKPCYVTEISEFLGVSPKAVIDHLEKLEEAGLVESRTDDRRRKYFSIARHVLLEVTLSPYEFGTKSAYPRSSRIDIASCRRVSIELDAAEDGPTLDEASADETSGVETDQTARADTEGTAEAETDADVAAMARKLRDLEHLGRELSMAQRWTQRRIADLREEMAAGIDGGEPRLVSELLVALADGAAEIEEICRRLDAPPQIVEELLMRLADEGVVSRDGERWQLAD